MVDSVAVILITYFFTNAISITPGETVLHGLLVLILSNYMFKMIAALVDTIPFIWVQNGFRRYLEIDPNETLEMKKLSSQIDTASIEFKKRKERNTPS